jgi:DNA-directed RNA polymerase beta subunit
MRMFSTHQPKLSFEPIEEVQNDDLSREDLFSYLFSVISDEAQKVTTSQEIGAYNSFADHGLHYIIKSAFNIDTSVDNHRDTTDVDKSIKSFRLRINFTDTMLDYPKKIDKSGLAIPRNPDDYRINNGFYSADLIVSANISITAMHADGIEETKETTINGLNISAIPVMVRSSHCNTYKATSEMLRGINEDPNDTGGYFISNGKEYVINAAEYLVFNKPLIVFSTLKSERARAAILSQRENSFGNSTHLLIKLNTDFGIVFEIQTYTFSKLKIPFYTLYRMFGVNSDRRIAEMIVYDYEEDTPETNRMMEIVMMAFQVKYTVDKSKSQGLSMTENLQMIREIISDAADPNAYKRNDESVRYAIGDMRRKLDMSVLPHIGVTEHERTSKLRQISVIIRDMLMLEMGLRKEDDRDHYTNKRAHGAGISLARATRTLFNSKVVQPMVHALRNEVISKSMDTINMSDVAITISNLVSGDELKNAFEKYINASSTDGGGRNMKEKIRMNAQHLERKNKLAVCVINRTVVTSISKVAKSTKRSDKIRFWHSSAAGLICPASTPESGEKVGTVKQLALTAIITNSDGDNLLFKKFILADEEVIPLLQVNLKNISKQRLALIKVDGDWLGCCKHPHLFVDRYRKLKREGVLDRYCSIEWNSVSNIILFYTDLGRLIRPLLIVDNNLDDFNSGKTSTFVQNIRLTHNIVEQLRRGKKTFDDLVVEGYIEYIYPGEEVLLCSTFDTLKSSRNNIAMRWTHCDIEQSLFGLSALMGPFIDRNLTMRNTLVSLHSRQSCGQPITNIRTCTRKSQRFNADRVEDPLVKTITRELLPPNSQTLMVLYAVLLGYNQEDSSMANKGSIDRGMLAGVYYKMETIELEKNQSIRRPKEMETSIYRRNMSYGKLGENGIVTVGVMVERGDIILGRVVELAQPTEDGKRFIDKSYPYNNDEPGRVVSVISKLEGEDKFVVITFEYDRTMVVGDKACLLEDHDVLTERGWVPIADVTMKDKVACLSESENLKYEHPVQLYDFDHDGEMYELETQHLSLNVTGNHNMWVSRRKGSRGDFKYRDYEQIQARHVHGKRVKYRKDVTNIFPDIKEYQGFSMDSWLKLLGMWISDGFTQRSAGSNRVEITATKERKLRFIRNVYDELDVKYCEHSDRTVTTNKTIYEALSPLSVGALQKHLPDYVWQLSQRQACILLDSLVEGDGSRRDNKRVYYTSSVRLRDDVMRLCLHAGCSGTYKINKYEGESSVYKGQTITHNAHMWCIGINTTKNRPEVNHGHCSKQDGQTERLYNAKVKVYCLEVPEHVMYVRRNGKSCWVCNSSRAGNKNIFGLTVPQADMPITESGLTPDLIINPHSIPTRMTLAQLFETVLTKLCAKKGIFIDGTVYKRFDVHELLEELEKEGLAVRDKMVNGRTGEMFETLLFYGPQTIFRLPKFVKEDRHAVGRSGPINHITGQALTGKRMGGGHKVGEMEQWVMLAQGAMSTLFEEFYLDSDHRPMYICRSCDTIAIYNANQSRYRCKTCGDGADICSMDSSKTSMLFLQELAMANIRVKIHPEGRRYEEPQV